MLEIVLVGAAGLVLLAYVYGSAFITYCIVKSAMFAPWQKAIIIAFNWLVPFIVPAFMYRLLEDEIADTNVTKPPLVTLVYLASDISWSYGNGPHHETSHQGSDSSGGDSH